MNKTTLFRIHCSSFAIQETTRRHAAAFQNSVLTRRETLLALAGGVAAGACARPLGWHGQPARAGFDELILCGAEEVFILSVVPGKNPKTEKTWSWRAADCPNLPESLRPAFKSTDDCKPFEGGREILITSSSGAVALVERETKRAVFYAPVVNAHSAEMLSGGRIVACASVSTSPLGNRLVFFDANTPEKEISSDSLQSAHGVVWDEARRILWALGYDELRAYRLSKGKEEKDKLKSALQTPVIEREALFPLSDTDGHDLSPIPGTPLLFISTGRHCWYFDRDKRRFAPHDVLADAASVKSYSVHPSTGRIAYVQAEGSNWWAERVHFLRPVGILHLPGQRLYKARWNAKN